MASWSTKRKYGYFFVFIVVIALIFGVPSFFVLYKPATCSDNKQNQGEHGVDCGGPCSRLCPADFAEPRVLWSYSMQIVPRVYSSLAYVQNPNQNVEAKSMPYIFKIYDDKGLLIVQKEGSAFVPAGQKFAVFESGIQVGQRIPFRTTFEFSDLPLWRPGVALTQIRTLNTNLDQGSAPKADVTIHNDAVDRSFSSIDAFIILYDKDDNRVAFSKTTLDSISPDSTQTLYFTWPEAFAVQVVRTEVLFVARPQR